MTTKMYKAFVKSKETGELTIIESEYTSKKGFAHDLRVNGYAVRFISTPEKFDEDCEKYHWELERRKNVREAMKQHKASKEQEVQEAVEQTETETNETTDETETEETVEQAAEQETVEGISETETTTGTDDSGFEYTTSQAQEIIMTGTSIAREKYREKHGIHSPMDLKKFSKKQLDDYLSKELDYINKFLNDTIPKEVFNAIKGEIMYA